MKYKNGEYVVTLTSWLSCVVCLLLSHSSDAVCVSAADDCLHIRCRDASIHCLLPRAHYGADLEAWPTQERETQKRRHSSRLCSIKA